MSLPLCSFFSVFGGRQPCVSLSLLLGFGFLLGLGWVEGVEFEGALGGRVERVGKMIGRWKKQLRMVSWEPFWDSHILQNLARSHPQIEKSTIFEGSIVFNCFWPKCVASFHDFGVPPGSPKFAKKTCFSRKWGSHDSYFSIFVVNAAATNFFIESLWIFDQKTVVSFVCALQVVLYFCGHGDPHDTS